MSRSNHDKPFYVDAGTSVVAIRCASNHDVIARYAIVVLPYTLNLAKEICDRMNREAEIGRTPRNCNMFETLKEARIAYAYYLAAYIEKAKARNKFDLPPDFDEWLFESAKEKEGDNNGSK